MNPPVETLDEYEFAMLLQQSRALEPPLFVVAVADEQDQFELIDQEH